MNRFKLGVSLWLVAAGLSCAHTVRVRRVTARGDAHAGADEILYALPRTVLVVRFDVKLTRRSAPRCPLGPTDRARLLLGDAPTPPQALEVSAATLSTRAEPDPRNVYAIDAAHSWFTDTNHALVLSERGFLSRSEGTQTSQAFQTIAAAAQVASALVGFASGEGTDAGAGDAGDAGDAGRECLPRERAELIREYGALGDRLRTFMETQQLPGVEGGALRELFTRIEARRAAIRNAFDGKPEEVTGTIQCEYTPPASCESACDQTFFRVSGGHLFGLTGACVVPHGLAAAIAPTDQAGGDAVRVRVTPERDPLVDVARAADQPANGHRSFAYRVPGRGVARIESGSSGAALAREELTIAQLGVVRTLPDLEGVSVSQTVALSPETGALLNHTGNRSVAVAERAEAVTSAITSLRDAPADAETRRLEALTRQRDRLQREREIRDLQDAGAGESPR